MKGLTLALTFSISLVANASFCQDAFNKCLNDNPTNWANCYIKNSVPVRISAYDQNNDSPPQSISNEIELHPLDLGFFAIPFESSLKGDYGIFLP